jgi:glycosyltransferase involved in cell wall biosynthesis
MPILVLDHQSSDATVSIAQTHGARVLVRPFTNFVDARSFALTHVQTPWTLMVDADEVLDDTLRASVLAASGDADGYTVSRTTYYRGKPLRIWSDERLLRLFRTDRVRLKAAPAAGGTALLHERWVCDGPVRAIDGTLEHYSYPDAGSYHQKYERYTDIEARGVRPSVATAILQTLFAPLRFVKLLGKGAAADGADGWYIAWRSALYPAVVQWKALRRS